MSHPDSQNDPEDAAAEANQAKTAVTDPNKASDSKAAEPIKATASASEAQGTAPKKAGTKPRSQKSAGPAAAAVTRKSSADKTPRRPVLSEAEIDAPNLNTLIMLGVIAVATLVLWAAGRAACNYHVPGESLTPRVVSLEDRTRSPKDVGLELAQALSGADFEIAEQLVIDEATQLVKDARAACGACAAAIQARPDLFSVAVVHRANSIDAIVEVKTFQKKELKSTRVFGIERRERTWKATRSFSSLESAQLRTPPAAESALMSPPSSGSAAAITPAAAPSAQAETPVLKLDLPKDASQVEPVVQDD